jgi:hypothetical protein
MVSVDNRECLLRIHLRKETTGAVSLDSILSGQDLTQVLPITQCATNRKVARSIPDGVTGIFQWLNPSGRIVALGSTQPLAEMSTRNPSWG